MPFWTTCTYGARETAGVVGDDEAEDVEEGKEKVGETGELMESSKNEARTWIDGDTGTDKTTSSSSST